MTISPVIADPEAGVTVRVTRLLAADAAGFGPRPARPPEGNMNRCCNWIGLILPPMPARSPVGEWQPLHFPAPVKYAAPAFGSPTRTLFGWNSGDPRNASLTRWLRKWEGSA